MNDQLGHEIGDRLIRGAAVLRESLRDTDVLARLGGDEFVAFALDDAHLRVILARLRENLHAFNLMQERTYRLSTSAGAVQCDPYGDAPLPDYVQQADRKMYVHKRGSFTRRYGVVASASQDSGCWPDLSRSAPPSKAAADSSLSILLAIDRRSSSFVSGGLSMSASIACSSCVSHGRPLRRLTWM